MPRPSSVLVLVLSLCLQAALAEERSINSIDSDATESFGFGQCEEKDTSISCQSIRIARNVLQQLIKARKSNGIGDLKIVDGVELVRTQGLAGGGRSLNDGSVVGKMAGFLQSHELRVKLPDLLGRDEMKGVFAETLRSFDEQSELVETGRRKGGKGDGGVMLMGLMMAKTLAAIGFGGLGLLTMKALMVSALALMLSAIIGVKKLASSGGDHDSGHQVHYVQAHGHGDHHRKRREAPLDLARLPYAGWGEHLLSN